MWTYPYYTNNSCVWLSYENSKHLTREKRYSAFPMTRLIKCNLSDRENEKEKENLLIIPKNEVDPLIIRDWSTHYEFVYHRLLIKIELRHTNHWLIAYRGECRCYLYDKKRKNRENIESSQKNVIYRIFVGVNMIKGLRDWCLNVLTRVKHNSRLKLHFFVSTELSESTSEISTFVWLRAFFCWRAVWLCTFVFCTSAVHLDNRKGYVSGFGEITFPEYHLESNVWGVQIKEKKTGG